MGPKAKSNFIQSVDRALQLLEVFSSENKELGVTEIANTLGIHKSTTFGLLATLENRGYVTQNPKSSKYKLGLKLFELGNIVQESLDLRSIARPFINDLVEKFGETVHLVVHDRGEVIYIDKKESSQTIRILSHVGKRLPMHCTGVGKCLLAYMKDEELHKILKRDIKAYTPFTITDETKLKQELEKIRENGYSFDMEEIELGLRCVAAPILNHRDEAIAAISISGPSMRMDKERIKNLIEPIKNTAFQISSNLGYHHH